MMKMRLIKNTRKKGKNVPENPSGYSSCKNEVVSVPFLKLSLSQMSRRRDMLCARPRITYESSAWSMVFNAL